MSAPIRCLANIPDDPHAWLWPGRIPAAALTLLVGDPGQGKSLLTLDLAARVSAGLPWPDGAPHALPADVLLLAAEDSIAGAVRRRLVALGADLHQIHYLKSGQWSRHSRPSLASSELLGSDSIHQRTSFGYQPTLVADSLARDAYHLTAALDQLPHCRLVIIDPLPAYLAPFSRDHRDHARQSLAPLISLAERSGAAVVAVTHRDPALGLATFDARNPMSAMAAMARAIYLVDRLPGERSRRLLRTIKNNFADPATTLAFDVIESPSGDAVLDWRQSPIDDADDDAPASLAALAPIKASPPRQLDRAVAWLEGTLAAGPILTSDLESRAAASGVTSRTLQRARSQLRVKTFRQAANLGGHWICALPANNCSPNDQLRQPQPLADLAELADLVARHSKIDQELNRPPTAA